MVDVAAQSSPPGEYSFSAAGGSSGDLIYSGLTLSSADDTLAVLQMVVACLGLDNSPVQPARVQNLFR